MSWSIFIVGFFFYYGNKKKRFSTTFSLLFFSGVEHAAAPGVADARFVPGVCLLDDDVVVRAGRVEMQPELLLRDVPVVDQRRLFVDVDAAARQERRALVRVVLGLDELARGACPILVKDRDVGVRWYVAQSHPKEPLLAGPWLVEHVGVHIRVPTALLHRHVPRPCWRFLRVEASAECPVRGFWRRLPRALQRMGGQVVHRRVANDAHVVLAQRFPREPDDPEQDSAGTAEGSDHVCHAFFALGRGKKKIIAFLPHDRFPGHSKKWRTYTCHELSTTSLA